MNDSTMLRYAREVARNYEHEAQRQRLIKASAPSRTFALAWLSSFTFSKRRTFKRQQVEQ